MAPRREESLKDGQSSIMRGEEESASSGDEKCLRGWGGRREAQGEGRGGAGRGACVGRAA